MKTNGVRIFAIYSALMFVVVFGLSALVKAPSAVESEAVAEAEDPAAEEPGSVNGLKTALMPASSVTEEPELTESGDPSEADNVWAMFLVNGNNECPEEYSNSIDTSLVYESTVRQYYMDSRVEKYVRDMFAAAEKDGVELVMVSAYRTNSYQQDLFDRSVEDRVNNRGMTWEEAKEDTAKEVQK
ncbi:MAG: D-alanyl-D-alanine carboxypeptidase family protein, partial [Oscillospiraceae bacterium]|nr:D-alanyl-D-alanine carboxypeptidase family protein [Oscillospiraceae bacterium]